MSIPADIEADCRRLVVIIDRQAVQAAVGMSPDPSEVDAVASRLIAKGFPVGDFVREVMRRRFGMDPEAPREDFIGLGIGDLLSRNPAK